MTEPSPSPAPVASPAEPVAPAAPVNAVPAAPAAPDLPPVGDVASPAAAGGTAASPPPAAPTPVGQRLRTAVPWLGVLLALGALGWAFTLQQRMRQAEETFARRQQEMLQQSVESHTLSRQAEAASRDLTARLALIEARVAETSLQRTQLEELMQSLSRSRDENVLSDIEAALRVAQQQSALTGSSDPLLSALKQTEERLARMQQPRLERVRRAALQDLDRVRASGGVDLTALTLKLDEVTRQVDELPLVSAHGSAGLREPQAASAAEAGASAAPLRKPGSTVPGWLEGAQVLGQHVWQEVRQLVRVTRIENPEAALLAPEQATFLRENLRLRLLNARLSLLSRQFDAAQLDMRIAQNLLERYFDRSSRRVVAATELLKQTAGQSRVVAVPRPEATLAAIVAATGGR